MPLIRNFRSLLLSCTAALMLAACTQGEDIASPGASSPGTPPSGGGGGGSVSGDACPSGFSTGPSVGNQVACDIAGAILSDLTLPFKDDNGDGIGVAYRINGRVDVGIDCGFDGSGGDPAVLTIEPGVTLFGEGGDDFIIVNRCSRIEAAGAEDAPIIFTSRADLDGAQADPANAIGEWGGLVILGRAPINRCASGTLGTPSCNNVIEGVTAPEASYGGGIVDDNSGTLRYVQVRFSGFPLAAGNELNGISWGGVGNGTTVDFVQVHNSSDDGMEMFGGTVNMRHIVLSGEDDDSLDTDNGWTGNVQFLLIVQQDGRGDNGMEMSSAGVTVSPATNPTIANFTTVGSTKPVDPGFAFRINTGHIGRFVNGAVKEADACFRWQDAGDGDGVFDGVDIDPTFNSVLFDCGVGGLTNEDPENAVASAVVADDPNNAVGMSSITSNFQAGPMELPPMATPFDVTTLGAFFEPADYLGAFGPDETDTNNWATGWTFALFPEPGCPTGTLNTGTNISGVKVCEINGVQTDDLTLVRGNYYELNGRVDIGVDVGFDGMAAGGDPAILTIEPGVAVFGNSGSDFLIVNRGSQIFSNGTRQNPVVFTSEADLQDTVDPSLRLDAIGEWGGLVILGRAPINRCATGALGTPSCNNVIEGVTAPEASYGGGIVNDNSGALMFTQVKFSGFPLAAGNELNGISWGGVGNGTTVDFVQVHNSSDDGMEMFGGAVNMRHIILTGNDDDSLDTDNGWAGNVQYLIIAQRDGRGDNGMEMSSAGATVSPATNPTIANFTTVGSTKPVDPGFAFRINTGHIGRFINGVVDEADACFRWQDAGDGDGVFDGIDIDPTFNNILFDCGVGGLTNEDPENAVAAAAVNDDPNNSTNIGSTLINTVINGTAESARPAFVNLPSVNAFFDDVDYIGAVENSNDDWWREWSCGLESQDC